MKNNRDYDELDANEFSIILNGLDEKILRKQFIKYCGMAKENSKYFLSKKRKGKFWNGFRETSIPKSRIVNSLVDDILKNNDEIKIDDLIEVCLNYQYDTENLEKAQIGEKILLSNNNDYIKCLFKLFKINDIPENIIKKISNEKINNEYQIELEKIKQTLNKEYSKKENNCKKKYESNLKSLEKEIINLKAEMCVIKQKNEKLEEQNKVITKEKNEIINKFKLLEDDNKTLIKLNETYNNIVDNFLKKFDTIIDFNMKENIINYIKSSDVKTKKEILNEINKLKKEIIDNDISSEKIEEDTIKIFVYNRLMEE